MCGVRDVVERLREGGRNQRRGRPGKGDWLGAGGGERRVWRKGLAPGPEVFIVGRTARDAGRVGVGRPEKQGGWRL